MQMCGWSGQRGDKGADIFQVARYNHSLFLMYLDKNLIWGSWFLNVTVMIQIVLELMGFQTV